MVVYRTNAGPSGEGEDSMSNFRYDLWTMKWVALATLVGMMLGWMTTSANGQDPRERRRQFFEGVLQQLIESQTQRSAPAPSSHGTRHVVPVAPQPTRPSHSTHPPSHPHSRPSVDPKMVEARRTLEAFSNETSQLFTELNSEASRIPSFRPLLNDAVKIRASAVVLAGKSTKVPSMRYITSDFQQLNQEWRILSYRLKQTRGLCDACLSRMKRLDQYDKKLCSLFQIQPQLNRSELIRQTAILSVEMGNLVEDIGVEVPPSPGRDKILLSARKVEQQATLVSNSIMGGESSETIVTQYRQFQSLWNPLGVQVREFESRYLERSVRRIWQTDRAMHELLLIPYKANPSHLLYLSKTLERQIDDLFSNVSLFLLIDLPAADRVLPIAGEFYGLCEYFVMTVEDNEGPAALASAYRDMEEAWPRFASSFKPLKNPDVQRSLTEIEETVTTLRESLGIRPNVDIELAAQQSALLENLAEHLERSLKIYLSRSSRYRGDFRRNIEQSSARFRQLSTQLRQQVATGANIQQLHRQSIDLMSTWKQCYGYIQQLSPPEKTYVQRTSSQITPVLVELHTLFAP